MPPFIWLKVSSLPPHTQILNIRFHPDHIYQCSNNLHVWQFHLPSLLYVSRPIVMQGKRNNHDNYCTSWNLRLLQIPETPVSNQLARTTFSVAITYLYQYNNYEAMKEKQNHGIYFTFCMAQGFLSSSSYPEPQFEIPSRPYIPVSNQLAHMTFSVAITFL